MVIAVCDDETEIREEIKQYLKEFLKAYKIKSVELLTFQSGEEMLCEHREIDIAFLDVEMKGISGIHAGRMLRQKNPRMIPIIITSHMEYLDEAMEFQMFRYLDKPVNKTRLFLCMRNALRQYAMSTEKTVVETAEKSYTVYTDEILCIEADKKRTIVTLKERELISVEPFHVWLNKLNGGMFFQTHRSFLINMKYVKEYDEGMVVLESAKKKKIALISRRKYYSAFKNAYLLYLEGTRK